MNRWNLLQLTSRTFYLSIRSLPAEIGNSLCLAYLLLRVSDYLEDTNALTPAEKVRLLDLWQRVIGGNRRASELERRIRRFPAQQEVDYQAAIQAGDILQQVQALPGQLRDTIVLHVRRSTNGMARWLSRGPQIETEADMDDYMHEVAGRVGYLSTEVFAYHSAQIRARLHRLMPLARETGLALQTVNVIRGLRKDFERGWIYVPESFCRQAGISREQLFDPGHRTEALEVLNRLVDKAERHLQAALGYVQLLPRTLYRIRLACIWPMLLAIRTVAISDANPDVFNGGVKMARSEVKHIVRCSTLFGWSNRWIASYALRLRTPLRPRQCATQQPLILTR